MPLLRENNLPRYTCQREGKKEGTSNRDELEVTNVETVKQLCNLLTLTSSLKTKFTLANEGTVNTVDTQTAEHEPEVWETKIHHEVLFCCSFLGGE